VSELESSSYEGESARQTTDTLPKLNVRELKREGLITPGQDQLEGVAPLEWTPCNFGGSRPWFVCPGEGCTRHVAILYGPGGPGELLCRHCRGLVYRSQREGQLGRAKRRMEKVRGRLATNGGRPKGMHHATYSQLVREYLEARKEYASLYQEWLDKLGIRSPNPWHAGIRGQDRRQACE
jgi:hypothetical protein